MPRLSCIGLAPAVTFRKPSLIIVWARMVAVVVPSPATSLVLVATSRSSWAPVFSAGSLSSISRTMVTPSLVTVGAPYFFSSTTLRPLGPSVMRTDLATVSIPRRKPCRASTSNATAFAMVPSLLLPGDPDARRGHYEDQQDQESDHDRRRRHRTVSLGWVQFWPRRALTLSIWDLEPVPSPSRDARVTVRTLRPALEAVIQPGPDHLRHDVCIDRVQRELDAN